MKLEYKIQDWGPFTILATIDQEFVDILLEKGNESRQKKLDYRSKLAGMIDNEYYLAENLDEWFIPRFLNYINAYIDGVTKHLQQPFKSPPVSWALSALWINYQQAKEYNPPHHHDGDLSFVMYLQVPDEIRKENVEMKGVHRNIGPGMINFSHGEEMPFCINQSSKMPEVGDLYIFPAWLTHYVHAFKSDVERISVSGNIVFKYEK